MSFDLRTYRSTQPLAIALGYFDAFHVGHRALLSVVTASGYVPALFTFEGDFYGALGQRDKPLYTAQQRRALAHDMGVDLVLTLPVDTETLQLECDVFFDMLREVGASLLVCGADFRFGRDAAGDVNTLSALCARSGIALCVVPIVVDDKGEKVGTHSLRRALIEGDMAALQQGLGRAYTIEGKVEKGRSVGRTLGVPTANISLDDRVQSPRFGVYVCRCSVRENVWYGVCNIGPHPTFGDSHVNLEAHLFDCTRDLYDSTMQVALLTYLRPIVHFGDARELQRQIAADIAAAKNYIEVNHDTIRP